MKIWPTWNQFKKWSLPSKVSFISGVLAIITAVYQAGIYFTDKPISEVSNEKKMINEECNVNIDVKDIYGNNTVINMPSNFCNKDGSLNEDYVVNYYWLDHISIGYLYSDINELFPIFGKKSFIWKNDVYDEMKYIVQEYWNEKSYTQTIMTGVEFNNKNLSLNNELPYEKFPVLKNVKEIQHEYGFGNYVERSEQLDEKYRTIKSYIGYWENYWGGVSFPKGENLNSCPVQWRYLNKKDIDNKSICSTDDKNIDNEDRSENEILCNHFKYIKYLIRNNYPAKFLPISERAVDGCGVGLSWSFWPRRTKLLVAVIENIGTKKLVIGNLEYYKDNNMLLREDKKIDQSVENLNFSNQSIYPNSSFVIPMRVELQLDSGHLSKPAYKYWSKVLTEEEINQCKGKGQYPDSPSTLIYGKEYRPVNIEINNKTTSIRDYNKLAITMVENWEKGSCPYLFVVKEGVEYKVGKILVKANGEKNMFTETIHIPNKVKKIIIKNLDHEIDYLDKIKISSADYIEDERLKHIDGSYIKLMRGEELTIDLELGKQSTTVEITGFYTPLY